MSLIVSSPTAQGIDIDTFVPIPLEQLRISLDVRFLSSGLYSLKADPTPSPHSDLFYDFSFCPMIVFPLQLSPAR